MSLPGYPFAKERYWIETALQSSTSSAGTPLSSAGESLEDIIDKIDDDSLETHEAVQLLRKIV
jgi:hypothetical protein